MFKNVGKELKELAESRVVIKTALSIPVALVMLIIGFVILLTGALVIGIFGSRSIQTGAWGLSFRTEGAPPVGNAGSAQLQQYDAAFLGDPGKKVIYLTFDAGYENGSTEKILDTLKKHQFPAAFFLVGNYIEQNPDLVRRMAQRGQPHDRGTWRQ